MTRPFRLACLLALILTCFGLLPNAQSPAKTKISPPVDRIVRDSRFIEYTFPAGMALHVLSQSAISTDSSQLNDPVEAITDQNLYLYEELVIPKNTRILGVVSRLELPVEGRDAILAIRFTEIILDNGERLPISAHVRTEHPEQIWGGKVTQGTKPVLSTQRVWGIGEYNRIVFAGPRAMGKDITLPPGDHWTIILDQPLTLVKAKDEEEY